MLTAHVVVGANYGDEGKGQLVHDIASGILTETPKHPLVVRYSGGAQAGHTVTTDTQRHVFHHFGSGTFLGCPTWLSKEFILNPMLFVNELDELNILGIDPIIYISPRCRVSSPYDMIVNIIREEHRVLRHGSCGCGINETMTRYQNTGVEWADLVDLAADEPSFRAYMTTQKEYAEQCCIEIIGSVDSVFDNDIIESYRQDVLAMHSASIMDTSAVLNKYDNVIFEGSQGLLLDERYGTFPFLTPGSVGAEVPLQYVDSVGKDNPGANINVLVHYPTRPYMTRHGAGPFMTETAKDNIGIHHPEETNVYNEHQHHFRYGVLDVNSYLNRIFVDATNAFCSVTSTNVTMNYNPVVTCESHMQGKFPVILDGERYNVSFNTLKQYIMVHKKG